MKSRNVFTNLFLLFLILNPTHIFCGNLWPRIASTTGLGVSVGLFAPLFQQTRIFVRVAGNDLERRALERMSRKLHHLSLGAGLIFQGTTSVLSIIAAAKTGKGLDIAAATLDVFAILGPLLLLFTPWAPGTVLAIRFLFHIGHFYFDAVVLTEAWKEENETTGGRRMLKATIMSIYEEIQHLILMKLIHNVPKKQSRAKHGGVFNYYHGRLPKSGAEFIAISR